MYSATAEQLAAWPQLKMTAYISERWRHAGTPFDLVGKVLTLPTVLGRLFFFNYFTVPVRYRTVYRGNFII